MFDFVNLLTLPMERDSFMARADYDLDNGVNVFGNVSWTEYSSASALAPTTHAHPRTRSPTLPAPSL